MPAPLAVDSASPPSPTPAVPRLESVDALRGLVMVLMALDHTRDFFHFGATHGHDPLAYQHTTPALFFTRWITHFCAPVFVFLAGLGASLSGARGKSRRTLSRFLLTRGLWLVLLELTWVQWLGWTFAFDLHTHFALVIWAIGWSMVALAALVHLPAGAVGAVGLVLMATHNIFDPVTPEALGALAPLWRVLHEGGRIDLGAGHILAAGYPLLPWVGVMAAGYGFGPLLLNATVLRRTLLLRLGIGLTATFILLRLSGLYGDPRPWSLQSTPLATLYSILDCQKYPPSLCYLLMTLGPAIIALGLLERSTPTALRPLLTFGRVPLFFYLFHLPLLHGLAVLAAYLTCGRADWLFGTHPAAPPADAGFGLPVTYAAWLLGLVVLFIACHWFAAVKRRHANAWLSYL